MSPRHGLDNGTLEQLLKSSLNPADEQRAWEEIEKLIYKPLYSFAVKCLATKGGTPDDYVQETMVRLWQRREELLQHRNLRGWLFNVLGNLIRDKVFRAAYSRVAPIYVLTDTLTTDDFASDAARLTIILAVRECINQLPESFRRLNEWIYAEEMTASEVSEQLTSEGNECSPDCVRQRHAKLRELVRECLESKVRNGYTT